jgi:hypothetical protein
MSIIKKIILIFILFIPFWANASFSQIDTSVTKLYVNFYDKVEKKYRNDKWLSFLYELNNAIDKISNSNRLNNSNHKLIFDLQKLNNEKIFNLEFEKLETENKKNLENYSILNNFKNKIYNKDLIFLENWVWYWYAYDKKYHFENMSWVNKATLDYNWINENNTIVFFEDWLVNFVKDYKKVKLTTNDIVYWVPNKYEILKRFKKNKTNLSWDDDNKIRQIKALSKSLTRWIYKKDDKIKVLYHYILDNIEYTKEFTLQDFEIFSWIETFVNKNWVCEWYVELFQLMLAFNDISSELLTWDVIDAQDFPQIGHAWLKIWEFYYDPTFDDPVWAKETKKFEEYKYYKLPRDLFYTNRYDYGKTPESLKNTPKEFRDNLIKQNINNLSEKYKNSWYNLVKPFIYKKSKWLDPLKDITVADLISIYTFYEFRDYEIAFPNKVRTVKSMNYTTLSNEYTETILEKNNYNLDDVIFLKWFQDNWNIDYIMVNDITYQN